MNALERVLETFEWGRHDGQTFGDLVWVPVGAVGGFGAGFLQMVVWRHNNDDPADEEVRGLTVTKSCSSLALVDDEAARREIREFIHWWACHEIDEQLWFGEERPFYPHDENGLLSPR